MLGCEGNQGGGSGNWGGFRRELGWATLWISPPHSGVVSLVPTPRMYIYINDVKFRRVRVKIYIICRPPCRPPADPTTVKYGTKNKTVVVGFLLSGLLEKTLEINTYVYTYMLTKLFQHLRILSE